MGDDTRHDDLLGEVQRLRGSAYFADGAIAERDLTHDGRHVQPADALSWHLVGLGQDGRPISCLRYRQYENTVRFHRLGVSKSPPARSPEWAFRTRIAVEQDLHLARQKGFSYVELGGWAIAPFARCTTEALRMVLATYALWRMLGGALGIATVTERHRSGSIVRRLGGWPLTLGGEPLPKYTDPSYGCEMQLLRFSSEEFSDRFAERIDELESYLEQAPVIHARRSRQEKVVAAGVGQRVWGDLPCVL